MGIATFAISVSSTGFAFVAIELFLAVILLWRIALALTQVSRQLDEIARELKKNPR